MRPEHKKYFEGWPDWKLMGFNICREAAGESREGRIGVGTVTLERVDHRDWDGKTIREVIFKEWQFSWTMDGKGRDHDYYEESIDMAANWDEEYSHNLALVECCKIAREMLQDEIPRDPDLAAVHCCQYLNPKLAAATKKKWLAAGMTVIKKIGNHEFFREVDR